MATFQLIGCMIDLNGNRDSVIVRSRHDKPLTYPEYLLMQTLHGGPEHVHDAMIVGTTERSDADEYDRLERTYGEEVVRAMFSGPDRLLPHGSESMITEEEVMAGEQAAQKARANVRAKRKGPPPLGDVGSVEELR